ncbi:hypothetical protein Gbth_015_042 [Gluconobacter thailandicus F149-1 = NBRC 100600]|uniref:Lipoprotein n=1 Tax=Gluconobacter thailandicus NBRC 3257 TaxID=1381097 RepID=A0ABQ0IWK6_GLUTH|nr:hypothetical protein [Gluconobacter thailandicus]KXV52683.1 hypothetical protein AD946_11730 [Gluconobacter thailandicus]GAC87918.1 hypothetical protein NBRC3255_1579 [Gluconobacter thailandicus NBRC 3255]GAD26587.1 hypothetical protein NBRC3257_1586 [Gluconobacter thailandicus NBRC 3257]GAN92705.1 hypothetical protein Gbth_015_042 [Gluconobacter thailandicus F149-1 = NBRC 100600]GBR57474.1 hypothetical protein AA100600_0269 [Gluconobacter thailandicus F149-1 = NBRC 100600]
MGMRYWIGASVLAFSLGLGGCADNEPTQTFPPADYSYLSQLHLNVATINIQDEAFPSPDSLSAKAPTPPDQALKQMAGQRLVASGQTGQADFIIKQAYISAAGENTISGAMDVQLNVADTGNLHTGYIHARISRKLDTGSKSATSRASLYELTNQMMQDMNVELEFQIRKKLMSWMTDAIGNPLVGGGVQQQSLTAPGTVPAPAVSTPAATLPPAVAPSVQQPPAATAVQPSVPDAIFPTGSGDDSVPAVSAPKQKSPPMGTLQLPSTSQSTSSGG